MARQTQGRIFKRGKKGYYYLQYYLNGKQIVKALRDENNKPITGQRLAQKATDVILAPYKANDDIQRRQQAIDALKNAEDKARDAERVKNAIKLSDAFELAMNKPRRKVLGEKARQQKESHWKDFVAYMDQFYPEIKTLDRIIQKHTQDYIQYLTKNGKFNKQISFKQNNKNSSYISKIKQLSPKSVNYYLMSCRDIFGTLMDDAGILLNPFDKIPKLKQIKEEREAFTLEELKLISQSADDFILSLFILGLCTGLREADICLLKWKEVNFQNSLIKRITRKTGKEVTIPIMPPLWKFLEEQQVKSGNNEYVLPEHAEMYLNNRSGISWRVKTFLESLGIITTKKPKGRSRAVSIKDVHSLRHSFCYYAGLYNVPLAIVQAVVGHMSPEMTKHYTMHATSNDIKKAFQNMPDLFGVLDITPDTKLIEVADAEPERQELRDLADTLPIDEIKNILKNIKK